MFIIFLLVTTQLIDLSLGCKAGYLGTTPVYPLDVCFGFIIDGIEGSTIYECDDNEENLILVVYNTTDCSGPILGDTTLDNVDSVECSGNECNHVVVREYSSISCIDTGDYFDVGIIVEECVVNPNISDSDVILSAKVGCDNTAVYGYSYTTEDCSGSIYNETIIYEDGHCDDDNQYIEIVECVDDNNQGSSSSVLLSIVAILAFISFIF